MNPVLLPCHHVTCQECVLEHFGAQQNRGEPTSCPICNQSAEEADLLEVADDDSKNSKTPAKKAPGPIIELGDSDDSDDEAPLFRHSSESGSEEHVAVPEDDQIDFKTS